MTDGPAAGPQVVVSDTVLACPRCGAPGLLSARVPHAIRNAAGRCVDGTRDIVLCATCDSEDPTAGPLITFFHVHEQITDETIDEFAPLAAAWAHTVEVPTADPQILDDEYRRWLRGEL